jgi:CheY-like chemotaxis protein
MDESSMSGGAAVQARPRILCVDDEPMVLRGLSATLRKHFEVITVGGAVAALELLAHDADLRVVISDYRMPGMDGGAFLARVRERFPTVIRILLSGAGAEGEDVTKNAGLVFRVLAKPCRREILIQTIEEALGQWSLVAAAS